MRTAFIEALCDAAAADPRLWLVTADLGYSVLEVFRERFPGRYLNVGVAEQNMVGVAAGLAMDGKVPFLYSIANFPTLRCLEQIRNDVVYHRLPVKVVSVGGGYSYGPQGYTHHGLEDLGVMRCLPGMTVVAPCDPFEARAATLALAKDPGPAYLRLGKAGEPRVHEAAPDFALGRACLLRAGRDVTVIATGGMARSCLDAVDALRARGVSARLLSMHTLKPLDAEAVLAAVAETAGIVTVEEHSVTGGLGTAVAELLLDAGVERPRLKRLGVPDGHFAPVGSQEQLRRVIGDIGGAALALLKETVA